MSRSKLIVTIAFATLALFCACMPLWAQFKTGDTLSHELSVCIDKKDAVAILDALRDTGPAAAQKVFADADGCQNIPVVGPHVGAIVYEVTSKATGAQVKAVEILRDGKVLGYFVTSMDVNKPERNS